MKQMEENFGSAFLPELVAPRHLSLRIAEFNIIVAIDLNYAVYCVLCDQRQGVVEECIGVICSGLRNLSTVLGVVRDVDDAHCEETFAHFFDS